MTGAEGMHPIHQRYADAIAEGRAETIPLGRDVLCDIDSTDLTDDPRSGGFMFESKAVGPCCADRQMAIITHYGEERFIRARCPEGMSFADWVRELRGPAAAIVITPGMPRWPQ
jgi:hypothetical protein